MTSIRESSARVIAGWAAAGVGVVGSLLYFAMTFGANANATVGHRL